MTQVAGYVTRYGRRVGGYTRGPGRHGVAHVRARNRLASKIEGLSPGASATYFHRRGHRVDSMSVEKMSNPYLPYDVRVGSRRTHARNAKHAAQLVYRHKGLHSRSTPAKRTRIRGVLAQDFG